jgi:O-antigen/teichoic acid export membrane protein
MTTYLGVLSISLLLLALAVGDSLATPLTVVGLMGLVLLRLSSTSRGWVPRRAMMRPASRRRRARNDKLTDPEGGDDA